MHKKVSSGFTLIELLIVVAIIGILAAIAVPNFLNAQLRARVARTNADLKALGTALDTYLLDNNNHPNNQSHLTMDLVSLTTPVSYISSVEFRDIFKAEQGDTGNYKESYLYFNYLYTANSPSGWNTWMNNIGGQDLSTKGYCLASWGPDRTQNAIEWVYIETGRNIGDHGNRRIYAPSNGLISVGDIGRWGGSVPGVPIMAGG
ncbi:MAG: type II secretion system protein [Candidatus Hinthialibacter sp.]